MAEKKLFCFGMGYTARALARHLVTAGWSVAGTCRSPDKREELIKEGYEAFLFEGGGGAPEIPEALRRASHVLVTIPPPKSGGDGVLASFREAFPECRRLRWLGYLSTTGVYGNRDGDWVDETAELKPGFDHQIRRAQAESGWLDLWRRDAVPVHIFRMAGIYGPGRNTLTRLRAGTARCIEKPELVFNRVHVADAAAALKASMENPNPGSIYNVCDDAPSNPAEVVEYAARLIGLPPPARQPMEDAGLSEMGRSFYQTNKRVRNGKIKKELGVRLGYPSYREGLRALLDEP